MKKLITNKPWKDVKTRKLSFILCVVMGTLAVIFGAVMICFDKFDSTTWFENTLNFYKWIVSTGVLVVLVSSYKELIKMKNVDIEEQEVEEDGEG